MNKKRKILVAGMGASPAVLTNAVWALAHQSEPVVPDEIVVFITKDGKALLKKELVDGGVWADMLKCLTRDGVGVEGKLMFGETSIRSIPDAKGNEIYDLRTGEDNLRASDFMLAQLRQYTEDSGVELHVSIAGGRKTMSALLLSCMTLLGREDDKVYHVLLPPEFEGGTEPVFFFPKKGVKHKSRVTGKIYQGAKVQSELFEVPFVRMRGWYQDKFKTIPPSYRMLISCVQEVAPPAVAYPEIEIDAWNGWVKVDGKTVAMSKTCFATLFLLAKGCSVKGLYEKLRSMHSVSGVAQCDWLASFQASERFNQNTPVDAVYKTMSELRKKLKSAGFVNVESLVPQRGAPVTFPIARVKWLNMKRLDIFGCPVFTDDWNFVIQCSASKKCQAN